MRLRAAAMRCGLLCVALTVVPEVAHGTQQEPVDLDLTLVYRPDKLPMKSFIRPGGIRLGRQDYAIAGRAPTPWLAESLQEGVFLQLDASGGTVGDVVKLKGLAPDASDQSVANAARDAGADFAVIVQLTGQAPTVELILLDAKGGEIKRTQVPEALTVHTAAQFRDRVRKLAPVNGEVAWRNVVRTTAIPVDFLMDGGPAKPVKVGVVATGPTELATVVKELEDRMAERVQRHHAAASIARFTDGRVLEGKGALDIGRLAAGEGCGWTVVAELGVAPGSDVVTATFTSFNAQGEVHTVGRSERVVMRLHGESTPDKLAAFQKRAVRVENISVVTTTTTNNGRYGVHTSRSRENKVVLMNASSQVLTAVDMGNLTVPPQHEDVVGRAVRAERGLWASNLGLRILAGFYLAVAAAGVPPGAILGGLAGFGIGGGGASGGAAIIPAVVGVVIGGVAGFVAMALVATVLALPPAAALAVLFQFLRMTTPSIPEQTLNDIATHHNLALASELGLDPLGMNEEYFPPPAEPR
ncbi:MAG: hypothetical protein AB2A00_31315 [Myxococcota bacterium]